MIRSTLLLAALAPLAFAQDAPSIRLTAVKNAPFTAQTQTESIQTLPDGNRVTRTNLSTIARDSEGRTRREQTGSGIVFIYDPVPGMAYVVDSRTRSIRQYAIASAEAKPASPLGTSTLGTDNMEGLPVEGTRLTRQIAVGEAGNEKPIEVTSDSWYSNDLQIVLSSRTVDPRTGETTTQVTGVKRAEPDSALFQIPSDYQMQNAQSKSR